MCLICCIFFFQAEDGIRDVAVTGVQTCALPIWRLRAGRPSFFWLRASYSAAMARELIGRVRQALGDRYNVITAVRSEEHTSEIPSPLHLLCPPLLGKKKNYLIGF